MSYSEYEAAYRQEVKEWDDNRLVRLYEKTRKEVYFRILYSRYKRKVYGKCLSMIKDECLAKDALQEVFMKLFSNIQSYKRQSKFSTWVYSITYNTCIDILRKQQRTNNLITSDDVIEEEYLADEVSDDELVAIKVERLKYILSELEASDREVLLMKYREEMSIREIGAVINKSESAVKMKISRAKDRAMKIHRSVFG